MAIEIHQDHPTELGWLYRFQLLFIHICQEYEKDYNSASAALGDIVTQAHSRGHRQLSWALLMTRARLAVLKGDTELATSIISSMAKDFDLPVTDAEIKDEDVKPKSYTLSHRDPDLQNLPRPLVLQFLVLLCIHQTNAGQTTAARQNIRRAQFLLDQKSSDEDASDGRVTVCRVSEPWGAILYLTTALCPFQLTLSGTVGADGRPQSITLRTLPRSVFYAYTFLISTIVQLDPIGRLPKCLHFAAAGLERLIEMFDFGWEFRSPEVLEGESSSITCFGSNMHSAKCRSDLTCPAARLAIRCRSARDY